MTDPYNPGTGPEPSSPPSTPAAGESPLPAFEPAEPGTSAPAQAVARDGASGAGTPSWERIWIRLRALSEK